MPVMWVRAAGAVRDVDSCFAALKNSAPSAPTVARCPRRTTNSRCISEVRCGAASQLSGCELLRQQLPGSTRQLPVEIWQETLGKGDTSEWLMFEISVGCVELVLGAAERRYLSSGAPSPRSLIQIYSCKIKS